jgi:hypothetical protein
VIDGRYGNSNSWIADFAGGDPDPYIGVDLGGEFDIARVAFGRDNGNSVSDACGGQCTDRSLGAYTLQVTRVADPGTATLETEDAETGWQTVGVLQYLGQDAQFVPYLRHEFRVGTGGAPIAATGLRIKTSSNTLVIDEIEIYPAETGDVTFGASLESGAVTAEAREFAESTLEWIELYSPCVCPTSPAETPASP